jgi:hypothetical protein
MAIKTKGCGVSHSFWSSQPSHATVGTNDESKMELYAGRSRQKIKTVVIKRTKTLPLSIRFPFVFVN